MDFFSPAQSRSLAVLWFVESDLLEGDIYEFLNQLIV